jgi:hypothetical protein
MRLSAIIAVSLMLFALCSIPISAQDAPQSQPKTEPQACSEKPAAGKTEKPSGPVIENVKPESADAGNSVTITGIGFGESGKVTFNGKEATVKAGDWTATKITAIVPVGATSGNVVVSAGGKDSIGKAFTIKAEYDQSAFELVTGVGAEVAGEEVTSYKVDTTNNALSQTNVGRKTVEILLGGGFILPWHRGGHWIEKSYCGSPSSHQPAGQESPCRQGGDAAYKNYRPWETFLSIRFAPASDQTINGFVIGGGYRITKYFTLLAGYAATPFNEPTHGFRVVASQTVAANPTISPYNHFNADDLLHNRPGAFDGFPLFLYNASGVTTTKIFPTSPVVVHYHSGVYFGIGIPVNFTTLFKPSAGK